MKLYCENKNDEPKIKVELGQSEDDVVVIIGGKEIGFFTTNNTGQVFFKAYLVNNPLFETSPTGYIKVVE